MTPRTPRPVVVVAIQGRVVRLAVIDNGAAYTYLDVAELCRTAGLEPRVSRGAVVIGLSSLPDLEALARIRGVVVQRRRPKPAPPLAFQPTSRPGVDDGPEPIHACAREHCRVRGCRYRRSA